MQLPKFHVIPADGSERGGANTYKLQKLSLCPFPILNGPKKLACLDVASCVATRRNLYSISGRACVRVTSGASVSRVLRTSICRIESKEVSFHSSVPPRQQKVKMGEKENGAYLAHVGGGGLKWIAPRRLSLPFPPSSPRIPAAAEQMSRGDQDVLRFRNMTNLFQTSVAKIDIT